MYWIFNFASVTLESVGLYWLHVAIKNHVTSGQLLVTLYAAELFVSIFRHLKLEMLSKFQTLKDDKYIHLWK